MFEMKYTTQRLLADADVEAGEEQPTCLFEGTVTVQIPPHHERFKFLKESGMTSLRNAKFGDDVAKPNSTADMMDKAEAFTEFASKASELVLKHVKGCELKHEDGTVITDPTQMWSHPDAVPLIDVLIMKFTSNFVGKSPALSSKPK